MGPHPGVGPHSREVGGAVLPIFILHPQLEPTYHSYYQWIPYFLLFQSFSFFFPYLLNKFSHDGRLNFLLQDLQNVIPYNENRLDKIGDLHLYTQVTADLSISSASFQDFFGSHGWWATKLVLSDAMNLVNLVLNILGVNWYLKGQFFSYGPSFLMYHMSGEGDWAVSPVDTMFPKMTKCTLELFGPSGTVVNHDGLCVLAINVLNEKIYVILWFLFMPLLFVTVVEQIIWLFFLLNKTYRYRNGQADMFHFCSGTATS